MPEFGMPPSMRVRNQYWNTPFSLRLRVWIDIRGWKRKDLNTYSLEVFKGEEEEIVGFKMPKHTLFLIQFWTKKKISSGMNYLTNFERKFVRIP